MELLEIPFTGPVLPATIAVGLALFWSLMSTVGAFGAEGWPGHHTELDVDAGIDVPLEGSVDGSLDGLASDTAWSHIGTIATAGSREAAKDWLAGISIGALRWLNVGGVPLMIWGAILSVSWWFVSGILWIAVDRLIFEPNLLWSTLLATKNLILAIFLTKLVTKPLKHSLTPKRITSKSLIGKECVISSTEATPEFGLVKFKTGGAPLLLNVRTDGPRLARGTPVWIVHYDRVRKIYLVSPTSTRRVDHEAEKIKGETENADL